MANPLPTTIYLMFQLFVSGASNDVFPAQCELDSQVRDIICHIGITGNVHHRLGFVVGPISFNQNDAQVHKLIADSFEIARKQNAAVAFHIDDHMFWDKQADLVRDYTNVEWIDWNGTLCTGRRLDWGPQPTKAPPQLCFNSPAVQVAVRRRARVIGADIAQQLARLRTEGREDLFGGVITGWETQIGRDFSTNRSTGYHALRNAGLNARSSQAECDNKLQSIVKDFIQMWAMELKQSGVPRQKLFSHIAFTSQGLGDSPEDFPQRVGYAAPSVVFGNCSIPGFSTYPSDGALEEIGLTVKNRGQSTWISAEGTNVVPDGMPGETTMESYLAKMFNHGAILVNIFSWGIGGTSEKANLFRRATENDEALAAYRKFLEGLPLQELARPANQLSVKGLQKKIRTIQAEAPLWVRRTGRVGDLQARMSELDGAIKAGRVADADKSADKILKLIHTN